MYSYDWDPSTGGYILNSTPLNFSKEPRPVYYKELDMLGFDRYWDYEKDDTYPYMWAEANTYWYRGRKVAQTKGGSLCSPPEITILEDAEPRGGKLRFVDVPAMVSKNTPFMEGFVQETIKKVYNTYVEYQKKADVFYVAFRFLYKGIIIKHNKTEPTYTKTSLFLCEKRRFFMGRTEKGGKVF